MSDPSPYRSRPHDEARRAVVRAAALKRFSGARILALLTRYLYLMRSSTMRIIELVYWPTMQLILWGFISKHFLTHSSWLAQAAGVLIAAVLLWDILYRSNLGFSIAFMEEMWSRNLAQLYVSPLRPYEMIAALTAISLVRTLLGVLPATMIAIPLYQFSIFELGLPLVAFFANLMITGWVLGLFVTALLLRVGLGAESVCWLVIFMIAPICAVYYPVSTLPAWLQYAAWALPPAYIFEGMRAILFENTVRVDLMLAALALNLFYFAIGGFCFLYSFFVAQRRGTLLQQSE